MFSPEALLFHKVYGIISDERMVVK